VKQQGIDFGVVGLEEVKIKTLNISNPNPVRIQCNSLSTTVEGLTMKLEGIWNSHGYRASAGLELDSKVRSATVLFRLIGLTCSVEVRRTFVCAGPRSLCNSVA